MAKITQELTLYSAMEQVVILAEDSQLSDNFLRKAKKYSDFISKKLNLSNIQGIILSLLVDNAFDKRISLLDLGKYLGCRMITLMKYTKDLKELEKREYILRSRSINNYVFCVPEEVLKALQNDEMYTPRSLTGLSCEEFFEEINELIKRLNDESISASSFRKKIEMLLELNSGLDFVRKIKDYAFDPDSLIIFMYMCCMFVSEQEDEIEYSELKDLFENRKIWLPIKKELYGGDHILHTQKLIEFVCDQGFANRNKLQITYQAKMELFKELDLKILKQDKRPKIKAEDIVAKELYYDEDVRNQVDELAELLKEENYNKIHQRLESTGFRCGFACLFYGSPGTGKTETVLQLARKTGRDVMKIDVSRIKSMWVGESEKNIKGLFAIYREKVKESKIAPILLFNEADAIIGKRKEGAETGIDKMENSIQNIILQEMETLDGIMIATTNLEQNMDKAFERRFLYKICFTKPNAEARLKIWQSMIPDLSTVEYQKLSDKYEFSGGQIENIARRYTIEGILHGVTDNALNILTKFCDTERIEKRNMKIGF